MKSNLNKFKERALTIDSIGLLYILVVGGLCHILPIPEMIKGFLALPGFLIIPYYFGEIVLEIFKKQIGIGKVLDKLQVRIFSWCIGYLSIVFIGLLLFGLRIFDFSLYIVFILSFIFFGKFYLLFRRETQCSFKINFSFDKLFIILILLFSSLVVPLFLSYFFPDPYVYGYDVFRHTHYSLRIMDFNFLTYTSDHFPSLYLILSGISSVFNVEVWTLLWTSKFLLSFLLVFGMFLFSYEISKDKRISILSATIAPRIYIYGFGDSFHSLFAIQPKTILFVLLPLLLYLIIKCIKYDYPVKNKQVNKETEMIKAIICSLLVVSPIFLTKVFFIRMYFEIFVVIFLFFVLSVIKIIYGRIIEGYNYVFLIFTIVGSTMVFIHISMGFAIFSIILVSLIPYFLLFKRNKGIILLYFIILLFFLFSALEIMDIIKMPVIKPASGTSISELPEAYAFLDIHQKMQAFKEGYTPFILFLFVIGFIFSLSERKKLIYIIPISFLLFVFFLPIEVIYRILTAVTPFICYFAAVAIFKIYSLNNHIKTNFEKCLMVFLIFCIIVILMSNVMNNYSKVQFKSEESKNENINFMMGVLTTSDWIKKNTKKDTLIISDPYTMFKTAGLSDRAYLSRSLYPERIHLLYDILSLPTPNEMHEKILSLDPTARFPDDVVTILPDGCIQLYSSTNRSDWEILIVITGTTNRFVTTYKKGDVFVSGGYYPIDKNFLNKFNDKRFFEQVYSEENKIYIFKVKNRTEQNESTKY